VHARFLGQPPTLAVIAVLAGGDEVVPGVSAPTMAGNDVIESQVVRLRAAVLACVLVADEDLAARQPNARSWSLDAVVETYDARSTEYLRGCPNFVMVVLDDLRLLTEDESERPPYVADVEWFVVRVKE
jgi:hypothetical protein